MHVVCLQNMPVLCPPEYMVCFLHRLISALRYYWDEYKASNPRASFSEGEWGPASSEKLGGAASGEGVECVFRRIVGAPRWRSAKPTFTLSPQVPFQSGLFLVPACLVQCSPL